MYSVDLTVGLRMEGTKIPQVVRDCVHAVEQSGTNIYILTTLAHEAYSTYCIHWACYNALLLLSAVGMDVQGIYRVSGARDDIYTIKADFDSGI